jgi:hypothetical protein
MSLKDLRNAVKAATESAAKLPDITAVWVAGAAEAAALSMVYVGAASSAASARAATSAALAAGALSIASYQGEISWQAARVKFYYRAEGNQ